MEGHLFPPLDVMVRTSCGRGSDIKHITNVYGGDKDFHSIVDEMLSKARNEILFMLSPPEDSPNHRHHALDLLEGARRRGVHVRALVPSAITASRVAVVREMGAHPGYRARDYLGQNLVITDGREAALRPVGHQGSAETLFVSAHPLVRLLSAMFDTVWSSSIPLAEVLRVDHELRGGIARSILMSLSAGEKDEVAARNLGMSVRTYRRHVANIMRCVRANSRFQAGVRASQLGLISCVYPST